MPEKFSPGKWMDGFRKLYFGPLRSWQVILFNKFNQNFKFLLKQSSSPSITPPQRSMSIEWIPHLKFFYFKFRIKIKLALHTNFNKQ